VATSQPLTPFLWLVGSTENVTEKGWHRFRGVLEVLAHRHVLNVRNPGGLVAIEKSSTKALRLRIRRSVLA
jgi:hypothetical protein